jgi:hypothetical protein
MEFRFQRYFKVKELPAAQSQFIQGSSDFSSNIMLFVAKAIHLLEALD